MIITVSKFRFQNKYVDYDSKNWYINTTIIRFEIYVHKIVYLRLD
jgi:hypothetical protein